MVMKNDIQLCPVLKIVSYSQAQECTNSQVVN